MIGSGSAGGTDNSCGRCKLKRVRPVLGGGGGSGHGYASSKYMYLHGVRLSKGWGENGLLRVRTAESRKSVGGWLLEAEVDAAVSTVGEGGGGGGWSGWV